MPDSKASAAVAIIRKTDNQKNDQYLILRRVANPEDPWSGHFSFPGGRSEIEDKDILATCLRETAEETGLALSPNQLLKRLPLEPAGRNFNSPLWVQPFLFSVNTVPALTLEQTEIQSFVWLDAHHFKDPQHHSQVEMFPGRFFPAYPIADYYLWGFTYRLLCAILNTSISQK